MPFPPENVGSSSSIELSFCQAGDLPAEGSS
jgi:hypothetical protein